jgi:Fe-Mn family superoxide dismutase
MGDGEHNADGPTGGAGMASMVGAGEPDALAQRRKGAQMAFEVPPLPYDYNALEPHIDEETMRLHHDKHHQAYVDKANGALEGTEWANESVEQVLTILDTLPEDKQTVLRNNAGGHANHSMFWEIMSPDGGGEPEGELADAINDTFGSVDELKKAINDGGVNRFGSGWSWLVHDGTGLALYSTANQDSPIMQSDEPLLGIDVWEHAYYLKYQNRRPEYLEAWWNVVNWPAVAERYARAIGKVSATT